MDKTERFVRKNRCNCAAHVVQWFRKEVDAVIYTLTMNPAIDYVVRLNGPLEAGTINRSAGEAFQFGGKGINVSNVLRNLGQETVALGFVAGETGAWLERGLAAMGLATRFIRLSRGQTRINVKVKAETETEINGMGPEIGPKDLVRLYEQLDGLVAGDVLVLSGSVPGCMGKDTYEKILAAATGGGILTVVDAAGELLTRTLKHRPFLIKPNDKELADLFCRELETEADMVSAARELQARGARNVLVSLGKDGALLVDEWGTVHRMACPQGEVVNSVGAGDSMVAGFLAGWLETGNYDAALKMGIAAGSATAFSLGLADRAAVECLLGQMGIS